MRIHLEYGRTGLDVELPETLRRLFVEPAASVETAVADALIDYGPDATIAVIPKGPYVLAELEEAK